MNYKYIVTNISDINFYKTKQEALKFIKDNFPYEDYITTEFEHEANESDNYKQVKQEFYLPNVISLDRPMNKHKQTKSNPKAIFSGTLTDLKNW